MAIKDLRARQGNVNLVLKITDKADSREFEKFGNKGKVCNAKAKDDSGEITLTLWNDDVDKVNIGDTVKIENGWVSEWQGELQLSTGKFGKIEVTESDSSAASKQPAAAATSKTPSDQPAKPKNDDFDSNTDKIEDEDLDTLSDNLDEEFVGDEKD